MKEFKQVEDIKELQPGDVVKGQISQVSFMVTANYGDHVTAVRTVDITNPSEWVVLR